MTLYLLLLAAQEEDRCIIMLSFWNLLYVIGEHRMLSACCGEDFYFAVSLSRSLITKSKSLIDPLADEALFFKATGAVATISSPW